MTGAAEAAPCIDAVAVVAVAAAAGRLAAGNTPFHRSFAAAAVGDPSCCGQFSIFHKELESRMRVSASCLERGEKESKR